MRWFMTDDDEQDDADEADFTIEHPIGRVVVILVRVAHQLIKHKMPPFLQW